MAGSVSISGNLTGLATGTVVVGPFILTPSSSNLYSETAPVLASGANTVTVPSWATACIIAPPFNNTVALTLKGVTGDTGIAISEVAPTLLSFVPGSPPSTFVITAASSTSGNTSIAFF